MNMTTRTMSRIRTTAPIPMYMVRPFRCWDLGYTQHSSCQRQIYSAEQPPGYRLADGDAAVADRSRDLKKVRFAVVVAVVALIFLAVAMSRGRWPAARMR
jgi:hypothetical protein